VSRQTAERFVRYWRGAIAYGVSSAAFGYGSLIGAIIVGVFFTHGSLKIDQFPAWVIPLVSAAIAIIAVFILHIFIGFYRALKMLRPFETEIVSGDLDTQYPKAQYESQKIAVRIKNKSYLPRHDCVIHIANIEGIDNQSHIFPRLIEKFSIDKGETKQIALMHRTFRAAPLANDWGIILNGPIGHGWNGSIVRIPVDKSYNVSVRIGVPEIDQIDLRMRIWSGDTALYAEQI
jgi:hypothetical protein